LPSTKIAVVAIAIPPSRIQVMRAPTGPKSRASAKVQTHTPRPAPMTNETTTPTLAATDDCTPRDRERWTVAGTVSSAAQAERNGSCDSSTYIASHQARVPATTPLAICSSAVTDSGRVSETSRSCRMCFNAAPTSSSRVRDAAGWAVVVRTHSIVHGRPCGPVRHDPRPSGRSAQHHPGDGGAHEVREGAGEDRLQPELRDLRAPAGGQAAE